MNPERIRAAIRLLYPAEMTPTARNVLENILDAEELEAPVSAGASSMRRGSAMEERNELADILEAMDGADFMDIAEAIQNAGFSKGEAS